MPRRLDPLTPPRPAPAATACAWPGCPATGTYPAPVDPRQPQLRQYFCAEHIKIFNAQWNGLAGYSPQEIFTMQLGATWQRPTWKMGVNGVDYLRRLAAGEAGVDPYGLFSQTPLPQRPDPTTSHLPAEARAALTLFTLTPDYSLADLKARYRALVKLHHPDRYAQATPTAAHQAEKLQVINDALQVLKRYARDADLST